MVWEKIPGGPYQQAKNRYIIFFFSSCLEKEKSLIIPGTNVLFNTIWTSITLPGVEFQFNLYHDCNNNNDNHDTYIFFPNGSALLVTVFNSSL